ncbi:MAG: N-acetylneuraminate synthase family protein [Rhodospirillales bacterium]|nr:N-acetylneuraminate synthase family protein [Rhodospirillales bacterium]
MVMLGSHRVGEGAPCFITFEAGPTHDGIAMAKQLVELAAAAGADAIKFQIMDPERLMADRKVPFSYGILTDRATNATRTVAEPLYDLMKRRALSKDEWREVKRHCDAHNLIFFATIAYEDELELLVELGCPSVKIASADINLLPLIRAAARSGLCVQLDTGNSTIGEVEAAVDLVLAEGNDQIIIHHCPSGYPARLEGVNLRVLTTLRQMFPYPVGYSDHSPGWEMDVAAVALGANLVEKTITLDRTTPSVEHMFSLEPNEMKAFVQVVRNVEAAMGNSRRTMSEADRKGRLVPRRSAHLAAAAAAGTPLAELPLIYRRPGFGLGAGKVESLAGARLLRDLPADHRLDLADLVWDEGA